MHKYFQHSLVFFLFSLSVYNAGSQVLTYPEVIQEQANWCWAGSTASVLNYYGFTTSQCEIAEYVRTVATWNNFGTIDCCIDPSQGCDYQNYNWGVSGSMEDILSHFGGITTVNLNSYLTLSEMQTEFNAARPFIFRWGWFGGGGHFLVGYGLAGNDILYMNPSPGAGFEISDYNYVLYAPWSHTWTHSQKLCMPALPSEISGDSSVCPLASHTFSVTPVPDAMFYTWTLPSGWTGTSVTNTITVTSGTSGGTLKVSAGNSCGQSIARSQELTIDAIPQQPGPISGPQHLCAGTSPVYFIDPVADADGYVWDIPEGWTGDLFSSTISPDPGNQGGIISVMAQNSCGLSALQTLIVEVSAPDLSVEISGNTLSAATNNNSFQWIDCQNMTEIPFETNPEFLPTQEGSFAVIVSLNSCTDTTACVSFTYNSCTDDADTFNPEIYPNPASEKLNIELKTQQSGSFCLQLLNAVGQVVYESSESAFDGTINTHINVDKLLSGIYMLQLIQEQGAKEIIVKRFVKE